MNNNIGPMHEEKFLGNPPNNTYCLVLVLFLKVGIPPVKINIFSVKMLHVPAKQSALYPWFYTHTVQ